MDNEFEYQSNENTKSELNEEEDTEDMNEDMETVEADEQMNIETVVNTEDITKTVPKRDFSGIIKVVNVTTAQQKNKESEACGERATNSGQTIGKRVCGSINCQQSCGPNVAYCPTCMTKIKQLMDKQLLIRSQAVVNSQRQVLIKVCKCSVKGCTTVCLDETALKRHLETDHNSAIVSVENKGDDIEDMSEDIGKERDELMSGEDNNRSIAEPKTNQTKSNVQVSAKSGNTSKSRPGLNLPKKKPLIKRLSAGSGQRAKDSALGSMMKCIIVGCDSQCKDQKGLEKHLEVSHRLMYIKSPTPASSADSIGTKCAAPVLSRPSIPLQPSPLINIRPVMDKSKTSIGTGCYIEKQTKEVILNLNNYFTALFPKENKQTVMNIIELATKISVSSIFKIIKEFKDTGNLKAVNKNKKREPFKYKYNDEDRDVLSRVVYKLRDENRLRGCKTVYTEIKTSKEYNPTFKNCGWQVFSDLFKRFGFKIADNKIIDIKPSDSERERTACQRSKESKSEKYVCDWPGCQKQFKNTQHLIMHLRTHTNVKPFVCRYPKCDYRCAVSHNIIKHLKCHNKTVFPNEDNEELI